MKYRLSNLNCVSSGDSFSEKHAIAPEYQGSLKEAQIENGSPYVGVIFVSKTTQYVFFPHQMASGGFPASPH